MKDDTPIFKLLTVQFLLPLTISETSVDELIRPIEGTGYGFTTSLETVTLGDLKEMWTDAVKGKATE